MKNFQPNFSHIYIERNAMDYPLAQIALSKFPKAKIVEIEHYKDIFNRPKQHFQIQKSSMKLILAKKTAPFLYPASEMIQEYETPNVFYTTPILNCLYNCDYCFLQGMYPSGNLVIFVNENDFFKSIQEKLKNLENPLKPLVIPISYNTDLMAMENIIPITSNWIKFVRELDNLKIEIRTKSALFSSIENISPPKNVILSWTLSPLEICEKYERTAPPVHRRINSMKSAIEKGWLVRLCIDPVLLIDRWEDKYNRFITDLFREIDGKKLVDITLGVFRMNKDYFNRIRKRESRSDIYYDNYIIENGTVTPPIELRTHAMETLKKHILTIHPKMRILIWE